MTTRAEDSTLPGVRRRVMVSLFTSRALQGTGTAGAMVAATLIATETAGPAASGLPNAAMVLGTAAGAVSIGSLMARRGGRFALLVSYAAGTAGALTAVPGALGRALPLVLVGMLLVGFGLGGAQLSRYLATELYPPSRKGFALSAIVWSGTIGAVLGPMLIAPAARFAVTQGWPEQTGPIAITALATACCLLTTALLLPGTIPTAEATTQSTSDRPTGHRHPIEVRPAFRRPDVRLSIVAMTAAHVVMVAVMLMTPVQLEHHGHSLHVVGFVVSVHMIGMFALAPLSGLIADRLGGPTAIGAGATVLVAAVTLAALLPTSHDAGLPVALFLLGYGWNLVLVGGGCVLSRELPKETRIQLQGFVDAIMWSAAAVASLSAGPLYGAGGYPLLALLAGLLALAPLALLAHRCASTQDSPGN